jgi:hypothetical protein
MARSRFDSFNRVLDASHVMQSRSLLSSGSGRKIVPRNHFDLVDSHTVADEGGEAPLGKDVLPDDLPFVTGAINPAGTRCRNATRC